MAIDPRIDEAVVSAAEEAGQDDALSRKLIAWFEALSSGNEQIDDSEMFLRLLYDSTTVDEEIPNG